MEKRNKRGTKCPCPVQRRVSTPFSDDDNDNKTNREGEFITWIKAYVSICYAII